MQISEIKLIESCHYETREIEYAISLVVHGFTVCGDTYDNLPDTSQLGMLNLKYETKLLF